ncbi:MAG: hypothetical protein JW384_03841 [Nitrosomonadaceae bacterium]|nr:hypothetical protein [Nitrosomonadaceae bacterium]
MPSTMPKSGLYNNLSNLPPEVYLRMKVVAKDLVYVRSQMAALKKKDEELTSELKSNIKMGASLVGDVLVERSAAKGRTQCDYKTLEAVYPEAYASCVSTGESGERVTLKLANGEGEVPWVL